MDPMYDVPGSDIIGVCVDEDVVRSKKNPDYIRSPEASVSYEESDDKKEQDDEKTRIAAYNE